MRWFLFGVVAVLSLLFMLSSAGAFGVSVELSGKMYGSDGKQLFTTEGDNYWLTNDNQVFDIDPSEENHVVVKGFSGKVYGTGTVNNLEYDVRLSDGWEQEPVLSVYAGFYDPVRQDRTQLLFCRSFESKRIPPLRKVIVDLTCENIRMVEGSTAAYR